jgi:hypothetical protein
MRDLIKKLFFFLCVVSAASAQAVILLGVPAQSMGPVALVQVPVVVIRGSNDAAGFASATFVIAWGTSVQGVQSFTPTSATSWSGAAANCNITVVGRASCNVVTFPPFANPIVPAGSYVLGNLALTIAAGATAPIPLTITLEECTNGAGLPLPDGSCAAQNGVIVIETQPPLIFANGFED